MREIPEEGRLKTNVQRERDGLDKVIALEEVIRSTDSILALAAMTKAEQLDFFQNEIDKKEKENWLQLKKQKRGYLISEIIQRTSFTFTTSDWLSRESKTSFLLGQSSQCRQLEPSSAKQHS